MTDHPWPNAVIALPEPLCIGIGGVSRAGKTFLANLLSGTMPGSIVVHQDEFIPDVGMIPEINGRTDWERPESIDWNSFRNAIDSATATGNTVIVEGLFAFHKPEIADLYNKAIFITLDRQEFLKRKHNDLRWGAVPDWYIAHIWDSFLIYGQLPPDVSNPLILAGNRDFEFPVLHNYLNV